MELGNLSIVALKEGQNITSKVALIFSVKRTHNTKIHRNVLRVMRILARNKNVTWVHVCMKEGVAENLREEDLYSTLSQLLHIRTLSFQRLDISNRNT